MAGGTCLGLVARTVGDSVVKLVMPFVEGNILKPDWHCREAATYAFGSILEGPSIETLGPLVSNGLDLLLNAMRDENNHVKDTTAWALSRIFEFLHCPASGFSVVSPENLQRIVTVLLESINDAPNVSEKVCGAIYYLAQGYEDAGANSSHLTQYIPRIISELLKTAERTDGSDSKIRTSAYETLNEMIERSKGTCKHPFVLLSRSTVHEEAMLAIGALAHASGPEFEKYMPELYKYLEMGLQNFEEYEVCGITVGVIGDICRALEDKVLPYCDGIMNHLVRNLQSAELHRSVKPPIFACFGDIALAIGEHFSKYIEATVAMMRSAAEVCAQMDNSDEELMDYGNQLKRSIFEAYSGILQGFKDSKPELMLPHAGHLFQFIEVVFREKYRDESVTKAAVAVMGDLADALGPNTKILFKDNAFCVQFLGECLQSDDEHLKETANWTQVMIARVVS
ncbi:hypothetical protein OIU78_019325 [Salix suchowensis]|nr:hypothetical protein OIU78_019325 [Salix suchowensis]